MQCYIFVQTIYLNAIFCILIMLMSYYHSIEGVGGYARLFIALNHYLKATGAMVTIPEHYDCHDFNCNGVLQSIVNDRYVRLMAGHFPA